MRWSICMLVLLMTVPLSHAADGPTALSLDETVMRALAGAPELAAGAEGACAVRELAVSAGRLPDPALYAGMLTGAFGETAA